MISLLIIRKLHASTFQQSRGAEEDSHGIKGSWRTLSKGQVGGMIPRGRRSDEGIFFMKDILEKCLLQKRRAIKRESLKPHAEEEVCD